MKKSVSFKRTKCKKKNRNTQQDWKEPSIENKTESKIKKYILKKGTTKKKRKAAANIWNKRFKCILYVCVCKNKYVYKDVCFIVKVHVCIFYEHDGWMDGWMNVWMYVIMLQLLLNFKSFTKH